VLVPLAAYLYLPRPLDRRALRLLASVGIVASVAFVLPIIQNRAILPLAIRDLRAPVGILAGALVVIGVRRRGELGMLLRGACWTLVASAVLVVAQASLHHRFLAGRVDALAVYVGANSVVDLGTTRVLTNAETLALMTLLAAVAYAVGRRRTDKSLRKNHLVSAGIFSAATITFLGFGRNYLVAAVVALLAALLTARDRTTAIGRLAKGVFLAGVLVAAGTVAIAADPGGRAGSAVTKETNAYLQKVVGGLNSTANVVDPSLTSRRTEDRYAEAAIRSDGGMGRGYGVPYRPVQTSDAFVGNEGTTYVHNSYLWVWLKMGWLGLLSLGALLLVCLRVLWRRPLPGSSEMFRWATGCAICGVLASAVYAPTVLSMNGGVVLGGALGLLLPDTPRRRGGPQTPLGPPPPTGAALPHFVSAPAADRGRLAVLVLRPQE
jgi:O-antigen ligase